MNIDWTEFAPLAGAAGGLLIGAAAVWLAFANGRIAGISGLTGEVVESALRPAVRARRKRQVGCAAAFVIGLVAAPWAWRLYGAAPAIHVTAGPGALIVGGLLVGAGTRLAGGCTSGHGVCGLARLSTRSLAATVLFMATAIATVAAQRWLA